ncbi:hypothetical protein BDV97DRAFT_147393 [Delphinella strobiligena]|nr:hypothetical protein BDV97DRAFT_147393 [Delphinella strobiligena]
MVATLRRSLVKDATCAVIPIELTILPRSTQPNSIRYPRLPSVSISPTHLYHCQLFGRAYALFIRRRVLAKSYKRTRMHGLTL